MENKKIIKKGIKEYKGKTQYKNNKEIQNIKNKKQIKIQNKKDKNEIKKKKRTRNGVEFKYIEELSSEELDKLKTVNKVKVDPGKKNLYMTKDDKGTYFRYSNKQRARETKRQEYQKRLERYKEKMNISKIEKELTNFRSKTCNFDKFKEYIKKRNEVKYTTNYQI